jgi:rubrerythrin
MGIGFNANEILLMAERIERNGARFYRSAAEVCHTDEESRKALLELAEMEDSHERAFAEMRADLGEDTSKPSTFDPEGETAAYLTAMADAHVFGPDFDPADIACGKSPGELLRMAIQLEKESIVFYLGLRDLVPPTSGAEKVEQILQEEKSHVAMLHSRIAELG